MRPEYAFAASVTALMIVACLATYAVLAFADSNAYRLVRIEVVPVKQVPPVLPKPTEVKRP